MNSNWDSLNEIDFDFDKLLTPDPDFDKRIQEVPIQSLKIETWTSFFPELILDDIDFLLQSQNSQIPKNNWWIFSQRVAVQSWFPTLIKDEPEAESIQPENNKEVKLISVLEEQSAFYANRFQQILQIDSNNTLESSVNRYARILLYILEQFHIHWDKKHHIRFMVSLKKVLNEISTIKEEKDYIEQCKRRWYWKLEWELKDEIETLYKIYYECYILAQKELHRIQRQEEQEKRRALHDNIKALEEELLPWFCYETWAINTQEDPQIAIERRRKELALKRAQRTE